MESIWRNTTVIAQRSSLETDINIEAAVIGGGMAGILTAWFLGQRGIETVVLEADRIGSGQTQNTTAKITAQHGLIYDKLISSFGEKAARQYAFANQEAIGEYRRLISTNNIECQFEDCPAYLYSTKNGDLLQREAEAAARLGLDADFTTETKLPFELKGAVCFAKQAQFHPLLFLEAIAKNLRIYEHTRAKSVEGNRIYTNGGTVTAQYIIFATHYPFINTPGYYFMRMHQERSYVVALENATQLDGMYLGIDTDGLSFRNSGDMLLLGGGKHRTGENSAGGKYDLLRGKADQLWPSCNEVACWSAQDCITVDGVPYIGRFSRSTPNWYVATGFGKWGMTASMVSAMIISDLITKRENLNSQVFSPQRLAISPSAKNFVLDGVQAVKGLSREVFFLPKAIDEDIPLGHGGIIMYQGKKLGVYKNDKGQIFAVDCRCPHLGCQLEWNPDELSWDCPCHGSRFDYRGKIINNPAKEVLGL